MSPIGTFAAVHRCPLYGRFRRHSGHQHIELSARPPALGISLSVTLLGGLASAAFRFSNSRWLRSASAICRRLSSIMRRSRASMYVPLAASLMMKGSGRIAAICSAGLAAAAATNIGSGFHPPRTSAASSRPRAPAGHAGPTRRSLRSPRRRELAARPSAGDL